MTKFYDYIEAWGNELGSKSYYIESEQYKASQHDLPDNTIYIRVGDDGELVAHTVDDVKDIELRERLHKYVVNRQAHRLSAYSTVIKKKNAKLEKITAVVNN